MRYSITRRLEGTDYVKVAITYSLQAVRGPTVQAGTLRTLRTLLDQEVPKRTHNATGKVYQPNPDYRPRRIAPSTPGVPPEGQERPLPPPGAPQVVPEPTDEDWRPRGLCYRTYDPRFFPEVGRGNTDARYAKNTCADCPVQAECLDYALTTNPQNGIWGGTTVKERRGIRRRGGR